jgi:hypothetical protein
MRKDTVPIEGSILTIFVEIFNLVEKWEIIQETVLGFLLKQTGKYLKEVYTWDG